MLDDDLPDQLPDWAEHKIHADCPCPYFVKFAQLRTRDGRKIGNAVVNRIHFKRMRLVADIVTDIGSVVECLNRKELEELFYEPIYVMKPEAVVVRTGKIVRNPMDFQVHHTPVLQEIEMTVTSVTAYRADDGTLFPTEEDAAIHNDWLEVSRVLKSRHGFLGAKLATADSKNAQALFKITREVVMSRHAESIPLKPFEPEKYKCQRARDSKANLSAEGRFDEEAFGFFVENILQYGGDFIDDDLKVFRISAEDLFTYCHEVKTDKQAGTVEKKLDAEAIDLLVSARACIKRLGAPDLTGERDRHEVARAIKAYLNKVYGSTDWNIKSEPTKADPVIEQPAPEAK